VDVEPTAASVLVAAVPTLERATPAPATEPAPATPPELAPPSSSPETASSTLERAAVLPASPGGTLAVHVNAVPWARIEVDGIDLGETPLGNVPLRPGPHAFRAVLPDGRIVERTVDIDAAHRHVVFE
jgi:hypothetical protein